jgi:hypothetical protein
MNTGRLFYEDEFDALQTMVGESGKGFKACAAYLWPDLKPETGYAKLKDCLNPQGSEKLKFSQVLALMTFCERYDPLLYLCDETLHARPDRKSVDDEQVKLTEAIGSAAAMLNKAMTQLARLQERNG